MLEKCDYFPWQHVESCPAISIKDVDSTFIEKANQCAGCGNTPKQLRWIDFKSPPSTWENLFGAAGILSVCDKCHKQIDFFCTVMS